MSADAPLTQAEWLAYFHARQARWSARQHEEIARRLAEKYEASSRAVAVPVVFTPGHEMAPDSDGLPRDAHRWVNLALACGWSARLVGSTAADPMKGIVMAITLRAARHDERVFSAWHNGAFDVAWYVTRAGLERLGARRLSQGTLVASAPIESLPVKALLPMIKERGISIPTKDRNRDRIVAELLIRGVTHAVPPDPVRGVADALEGIRLVDASLASAVASGRVPGR
jgi:hypothetical protein